jgi:hypothetical protein
MRDPTSAPGPPPSEPIAEFLRKHALTLPEPYRVFMAIKAGPHFADGSALADCIETGRLPENTVDLLRAIQILQWATIPPEQWDYLTEALWIAFRLLKGGWDGLGTDAGSQDPDLPAFRTVGRRFEEFAEYTRDALRVVEEAGYRWSWEGARLEALPGRDGGHPRQFLRELVEALLDAPRPPVQDAGDRAEVREWIARELAPFFSSSLLDTRKGSTLYNAVENALRGR